MPEWVDEGVNAIYDLQWIISPGVLNDTKITVEWEVSNVFHRSFEITYTGTNYTRVDTIELNSPGHLWYCVFEF